MIYDNILGTIGKTPIVRIQRLAPKNVTMYVKCEFFNPMGSVKDRLAIAIIEDAERTGALKPGQTVVEATSGNTGIALAMVCAAKGYPFVATDGRERSRWSAARSCACSARKVILTPAAERGTGMVKKAEELAKKHGWFLARQFENEANPAYHRNTTGPEILQDFAGKRLDFFVTGWGTGGTLTGAGEMIRLARPETKIIATEPAGASLLSGKPWAPHKIQGWTPDFVPEVLKREVPHRIVPVTDVEAMEARARSRRAKASSAASHRAARSRRRESGRGSARRIGDSGDAAGYRRALSLHAAVRRNCRRRRSGALSAYATLLAMRGVTPRFPIRCGCTGAVSCTVHALHLRRGASSTRIAATRSCCSRAFTAGACGVFSRRSERGLVGSR